MADNATTQQLIDRINQLIDVMENDYDAQDRSIQSSKNLTDVEKKLITTNRDNRKAFTDLGQNLLQSNQVIDKFSESIKRADQINTKALGTNVTLQKVIDANSAAINESSIGYLRAAEEFVNNFAAGIRKTEGGTLRLTEQLVRTGQNTDTLRSVNNSLLGMTGRNYDALSKVNDAVLESADTYTVSTESLLKGLEKLSKDVDKFSIFGADVATNIKASMSDILGKFQGLNEDSLGSFFGLLEPSLDKIGTREMFGISDFAQQFARGEASSEQIAATMEDVGRQVQAVVDGAEDPAVALELVQKQFRVSQQQAVDLVNISRSLAKGPEDSKNLQATQEEQLETIKNQTELANKFYQKTAPQALAATVALLAPAIQTVQAINGLSMVLNARQGAGGAFETLFTKTQKAPGMPGSNLQGPPLPPAMKNTMSQQTSVLKGGFGGLKNSFKNLGGNIKSGFAGLKGSLTNFTGGIGGTIATLGAGLLTESLGEDMGGGTGKVVQAAGTGLEMAGVARGLGFAAKGLNVAGIAAAVADPVISMATEAMGAEKGDALDTGGDVLGYAAAGAALGSVIPGLGTIVGGLGGAVVGGIAELMDFDGDRAAAAEKEREATEKMEKEMRLAREATRAQNQKSDFALMAIVERVQSQQAAFMKSATAEQVGKLNELVEENKQLRLDNERRAAEKRTKDTTA